MGRAFRSHRRARRFYKYPQVYQPTPCSSTDSALGKTIVDVSVLEIFQRRHDSAHALRLISDDPPDYTLCDLDWYPGWLAHQLTRVPAGFLQVRYQEISNEDSSMSTESDFMKVFAAVDKYVSQGESCGIDEIVEHLLTHHFRFLHGNGLDTVTHQRYLVFSILAWQSMLFLPSFDSYPLNECAIRNNQFAIHQNINQPNSGLVFDVFQMPMDLADREMAILLKGLGNLLPPRPPDLAKLASETSKEASAWSSIVPAEVNAHILSAILRVRILWVDTLSLHLDYDQATRTLSFFRFPSFCVASLRSRGALYSFASSERHSPDPRASYDDITDILNETLLSYRLFFGQSRASRDIFRRLYKNTLEFSRSEDKLLYKICAQTRFQHAAVPNDRPVYYAEREFPILGERIKLLMKELKAVKPRGWKELLRDRRDTVQYWTFWLVAIIGSISIILTFIQVVLAGLALK